MDQHPLTEYRCACGKLLFRGLLLLSVVEVKCKRCGTLKLFRDPSFANASAGREFSLGVPVSFVLTIREDGRVYDACKTAEYVLAYPRETLLKMSIDELCPRLRESSRLAEAIGEAQVGGLRDQLTSRQIPPPAPYQMKDNTFLLRDGGKLPAKSYFVKSDSPSGAYHMVNVVMA
jgi:phage FluMu protein Com